MDKNLLNVKEASEFLRLKTRRLLDLVKLGRLRAWKVWGDPIDLLTLEYSTPGLRFSPEDLDAYLESVVVR